MAGILPKRDKSCTVAPFSPYGVGCDLPAAGVREKSANSQLLCRGVGRQAAAVCIPVHGADKAKPTEDQLFSSSS